MVLWLELSPHSKKKVLGLKPPSSFSVWCLHDLLASVRVQFGYSGFLIRSKNLLWELVGDSENARS